MILVVGLGIALAFEGLLLALAPKRIEEALALFARLSIESRRGIGLGALAVGVLLIALARRHWG